MWIALNIRDVKLWLKLVVWKPCAIRVSLQPLNIDRVDSWNETFRMQIFGLQMQLRIAKIQKLGIRLSTAPAVFIQHGCSLLQVHPMIKTLGPLEDAPDLDSIAPVLQNWAELIRNKTNPVSEAVLMTLLHADADTHCF